MMTQNYQTPVETLSPSSSFTEYTLESSGVELTDKNSSELSEVDDEEEVPVRDIPSEKVEENVNEENAIDNNYTESVDTKSYTGTQTTSMVSVEYEEPTVNDRSEDGAFEMRAFYLCMSENT